MFTSQLNYPKQVNFFSNINTVVSPPIPEGINLHLEIDGEPWKVEIVPPRKEGEQYWMPDPKNKTLYVCGLEDEIDMVKHDCWLNYHKKP